MSNVRMSSSMQWKKMLPNPGRELGQVLNQDLGQDMFKNQSRIFKTNVLKSQKSLKKLFGIDVMGKCYHIILVEHHILAENSQNM